MGIDIACPHCAKEYHLRDALQGKRVRCQACGQTFSVGETATTEDMDYGQQLHAMLGTAAGARPVTQIQKPTTRYMWIAVAVVGVLMLSITCCAGGGLVLSFFLTKSKIKGPPVARANPQQHQQGQIKNTNSAGSNSLDSALRNLQSADPKQRAAAAKQLAGAPVDEEQRKTVSAAIAPLLSDENESVRLSAVGAMKKWATADEVPALCAVLIDRKEFNQHNLKMRAAAIQILTQFPGPQAAEAIAVRLSSNFDRPHVLRALKEMGSVAEAAVCKMLQHKDATVRREACKLLGNIGTSASVPDLESAASSDQSSQVKKAAQDALNGIAARSGQ